MLELLLGGDPFRAGLLKKMGQLQTQPTEMLFFCTHMEVAVDLASQCFFRFNTDTLLPLLEEYFFHDFQLGCRLAFRFPPKKNPICQKMSQTWYATKQPVLTGWMFGDFQALFILKIWFIIQPKRPLNNGCLGYQVLEVEEPLFMKGPTETFKKKTITPYSSPKATKKTTTCFH